MTDVTIYNIQNRRAEIGEGRISVRLSDLTEAGMCKVWCINFRSMELEEARLLGVDDKGEHIVTLDSVDERGNAWAVPKENIFYDKHSAKKGLFSAHLKYE